MSPAKTTWMTKPFLATRKAWQEQSVVQVLMASLLLLGGVFAAQTDELLSWHLWAVALSAFLFGVASTVPTKTKARAAAQDFGMRASSGFKALDDHMLAQLQRVIDLSETSALKLIERVGALRGLSAGLMAYLDRANRQSGVMQSEIETNSRIIRELAAFVQNLPRQIADDRAQMENIVTEVRQLSSITETIRTMARQTEILSINAAIAAARAGEAGRAFSVLAGEVRRLAKQSNDAAKEIEQHIDRLVHTVVERGSHEATARHKHNEREAARLITLTDKLDEGYLDIRQFYSLMLLAVTEHNTTLDREITQMLDTAQYQDVFKQIIDRLDMGFSGRQHLLHEVLPHVRVRDDRSADILSRIQSLADDYLANEALHRDPDAPMEQAPGQPAARIELF